MAKIPDKPEDIFEELTADYRRVFGAGLVSITLYGSGAGGAYVAGKSDLNFLIVVKDEAMNLLPRTLDIVAKWKKRRVAVPHIMTRKYILSSLDVYPIEFLNMQLQHVLVYGEDVLGDLSFKGEYLRLQLEREFKGKLLHLRQGFLETEGKDKAIRNLVRASLTAFLSAFKALLRLKDLDIPRDRALLIAAVEEAYGINREVFAKCLDIREGRDSLSKSEIAATFMAYVGEIARLCDEIDEIKI
ncbi:MAG: hypothetical protein CSYNP_01063 [Syntrophus sp. SKADARSKE-3]|nr:hypothetical protein [Syntrophus sp. SKADARSKE-3]